LLFTLLILVQRFKDGLGYFTVQEMAVFIIAVIVTTAVSYLLLHLMIRERIVSLMLAGLFSYLFFNAHRTYLIVEKKITGYEYFASDIPNRILTLLLLALITLVIFVVAYRGLKRHRQIATWFLILFLAINIAAEVFLAIRQHVRLTRELTPLGPVTAGSERERPNIYYIVFDSYTSLESLEKYWGYTDRTLDPVLSSRKVNYSPSARTRFTSTPYCISSCLNMAWEQPVKSEDLYILYQSLWNIRNNTLIAFLKERNYRVENMSLFMLGNERNAYFYFRQVSIWGRSFPYLVYKLIRKLNPTPYEIRVNFGLARKVEEQSKLSAGSAQPVFTYAHLMLPHSRYLLDSAGCRQRETGLPDKERYLEQLKFARKMMVWFYTTIIRNDPRAVIIIQGDHGFRYLDNPVDREAEAHTVFNSMYLSGHLLPPDTLAGLAIPVNTFRIVLNKYFGTRIPLEKI